MQLWSNLFFSVSLSLSCECFTLLFVALSLVSLVIKVSIYKLTRQNKHLQINQAADSNGHSSLQTGCCVLTVTEKQSYAISLMAPPPTSTQQQETADMQTYKSAPVLGENPFLIPFSPRIEQNKSPSDSRWSQCGVLSGWASWWNPAPRAMLMVGLISIGPHFTIHRKETDRRDSTGNPLPPSNSMLLQLHTICIMSEGLYMVD